MGTFLFLWLGQTISLVGSGLTGFALGITIYKDTGSVTQFSLITLASYLPGIVLSPMAGVLVDRWDRRWAMAASDLVAGGAVVGLLVLLSGAGLSPGWVLLATAINSSALALQAPAYTAATTMLVPQAKLTQANGLVQLGTAAQHLVAPAMAGVLLAYVGLRGILSIDLLTFGYSLVVLCFLRLPRRENGGPPAERVSFFKDALHGIGFIRHRAGLRHLLVFFVAAYFIGGFVIVLDAPLVLSFASERVLGLQLSISASGMLVGSLVTSLVGAQRRRVRLILFAEVVNAACMIAGSLHPSAVLITVTGFVWFFTVALLMANDQTIWQLKVPVAEQGRVIATKRMIQLSSMPLAYLLAGPLVERIADPLMASGGGLATSAGAIIGTGPGRGIALVWLVGGVLKLCIAFVASRSARLMNLEDEIPDAAASALVEATSDDEQEERLRLVSIAFSHFCEKVRWALDRRGLPYREEPHVPCLHWVATFGAGARRTVPVLKGKGLLLRDSTAILQYLDVGAPAHAKLYPEDAAAREKCAAWEELFDERLGGHVRRLFYGFLLPNSKLLRATVLMLGPRWERILGARLLWPFRLTVTWALGVNAEGIKRSRERVEAIFTQVEEELSDGRPYLVGDRLSAADLTFAALAAPLVRSTSPFGLPSIEEASAEAAAFIRGLRARPAGAFVERLYAEERARVLGLLPKSEQKLVGEVRHVS